MWLTASLNVLSFIQNSKFGIESWLTKGRRWPATAIAETSAKRTVICSLQVRLSRLKEVSEFFVTIKLACIFTDYVVGSGSGFQRHTDPSLLKTLTASGVLATSKLSKDKRPRKKATHVIHYYYSQIYFTSHCHCLSTTSIWNAHFRDILCYIWPSILSTEESITRVMERLGDSQTSHAKLALMMYI